MKILGISAYYHDAAACLLEDGVIVAAAQEERFSRKKHDASFPSQAIRYCLAEGRVGAEGLDAVAFYDKPLAKFHRLLETYFAVAPRGLRAYLRALPVWLKKKLWLPPLIEESLRACGTRAPERIHFAEHHASHAASAFYPSPFEEAAVLTLDGVGEWATTTIGVGEGARLRLVEELRFPHSLGLLYAAFTAFAGFKPNSGEYKLMGLAPYGRPVYADRIREHLIDVKPDGSFHLDLSYFGFLDDLVMTNERFAALFDGPPRRPESPIGQREKDLARSVQEVLEEVVLSIARHARAVTGKDRLCLAGGVALNCVANGRLVRERIFEDVWIQPAAGDAGGAVGAALALWHDGMGKPRTVPARDGMRGALLGPAFPDDEIRAYLDARGYPHVELAGDAAWADAVAAKIAEGAVVGLFQGRMELGPRALGNRSIVGDPRSPTMQSTMNLKIKHRESFRPFAPSCLLDRAGDYFELDRESPYMLLVAPVREGAGLPAVTHVDRSARVQTVDAETNPRFYALLRAFARRTGCGVLINTSFNLRGEPIVGTPEDAYRCFARSDMDYLALGPFLLAKADQPRWNEPASWRAMLTSD